MRIISKRAALLTGARLFFTGDSCIRGHVAQRLVSSGCCYECSKENARKWHRENREKLRPKEIAWAKANPEKVAASIARWRAANPERVKENYRKAAARWRANNPEKYQATKNRFIESHPTKNRDYMRRKRASSPEKVSAYAAQWRKENRAKCSVYSKAWRERNPEKARALGSAGTAMRRARKKASAVPLTKEERRQVRAIYKKCREKTLSTGIRHHVDHIRPIAKGGLHHPANLQILTAVENISKGAR